MPTLRTIFSSAPNIPRFLVLGLGLAAVSVIPASLPAADAAAPVALFNGRNLDGWTVFTQDKDPENQGIFQVSGGTIQVYASAADGSQQTMGYLITTAEYADYHLSLEYKWGDKKFAPRATADSVRDAGVCFHVRGADEVWPVSVECQIQEGDTGDAWLIHTQGTSHVHRDNMNYWTLDQTSGVEQTKGVDPKGYQRFLRSYSYEKDGWNRVEVIVRGDSATYVVNGHVCNRVTGLKYWDEPSRGWRPLTKGRILLQAEGAEISYRNVVLEPLPDTSSLAPVAAAPTSSAAGPASGGKPAKARDGAADGIPAEPTPAKPGNQQTEAGGAGLSPFKELIRAYEPNQLGLTQDKGDGLFMDFTLSLMFPLFHTYYPDLLGVKKPGYFTVGNSKFSTPLPYFTATVRGGQYIGTRYSSPVVAKRFNPQFVLRSWTFQSFDRQQTKEALDNFVELAYGHESNGQSISNPDRFNELFQVNLNNEKHPTDPAAIDRARLSARDSISRGWDYVGLQVGWGRSETEKNAPKAWEKLPGVFTLRAKFNFYLTKGLLQGDAEEYNAWEADTQGKPRRKTDGISVRLTGTIPLLKHTRTPAWFHLENRWALTWTTGYSDAFRYNTLKVESGLKLINLPVLVWYRAGYNSDLVDYYRKDHSWGLMVSFWEF